MHIPTFRTFRNDRLTTWVWRALQVGTLLAFASRESDAQDSAATHAATNIVGVSVGIAGVRNQVLPLDLAIVGISVTHVEPRHLGFDLSVGTIPRLLADGTPIFGVRAGLVLPVPVAEHLTLLPGAGLSGLGNGDGGVLGWNANLGMLSSISPSTALRTGISLHQFVEEQSEVAWLYELGIVWFVH